MRVLSSRQRAYPTRSTAAKRAASQQRARQRRRAQRSRVFQQSFAALGKMLGTRTRLSTFHWSRMRIDLRMPGFSGFVPSKLLSLALLVGVVSLIAWFHDSDRFFVYQEDVHFVGATFLQDEDLYQYCDVDAWSIFWLNPSLIREQVLEHPYVADARVEVRWPAQVTVHVEEVQPVAGWSTDAGSFWLLADGTALPIPEGGAPASFQILDPLAEARFAGSEGGQIEPYVLETGLALRDKLGLDQIWYNRSTGLNFQYPGTKTWVYWGDGLQFDAKLHALEAARAEIEAQPEAQRILSLVAPNRPYFRSYVNNP